MTKMYNFHYTKIVKALLTRTLCLHEGCYAENINHTLIIRQFAVGLLVVVQLGPASEFLISQMMHFD